MNIASEVQDYLKSLTVLYVEDEADVREQFRQFLSRLVGVLITAENGSQGLAAYREHNPDIIITDIQMPVMDGLAMLEEIRSVDTWVPVIMLTAFEKTDCLKRSINLGVSGYVIKPIEVGKFIESLLKCARSLLLEKKVTQQNEELRDLLIRMTEQNKELELLASTDALTGLTNRRRFLDSLEKE
ncbi:MAG: response regulator, partial [Deltaproteobacteria bacterium]